MGVIEVTVQQLQLSILLISDRVKVDVVIIRRLCCSQHSQDTIIAVSAATHQVGKQCDPRNRD